MSVHHTPPPAAKGLCVLTTDGRGVARVDFDDTDTGCQHSPDGDLVITRAPCGGRRRVVTSFPAGRWLLAAWILGVGPDGRLQIEDVEWPRPQVTGDPDAFKAAFAADRTWFAANSSATSYVRHALPGEWSARRVGKAPAPEAVLLVEVRYLAPGCFSRAPAWALPLNQSSPHEPTAQENE